LLLLILWSISITAQVDPEIAYERSLEKAGDLIQLGLPISALALTLIEKDWEGSKQLTLSFGTNLIITHGLKALIDKRRPENSLNKDSFPSGHTSAAFQGASFIQRRYGWKHGKYAYLLAAFVGYSRIEGLNDRHDTWDVLVGAAIGVGSTYLFTTPFNKKNLKISFSNNHNYKAVSLLYSF